MKPLTMKKIVFALLFVCAAHIATGSFTGSTEKRTKNLYSLSSFNKTFYKSASPFSLRAGFSYKGYQTINQKKEANGEVTFQSMLRFEKGNTTYIYPYSHKVSTPRFKTPTPPIR